MPTHSLLVRLPNWVGDVIMTLPALKLLENHDIEPILIGRPWIHQLLQGTNFECISLEKSFVNSVAKLKNQPCKEILLFPNSFSSALMARMAGKIIYAYPGDGRSPLLNHALKKPDLQHESLVYYQLVKSVIEIKKHHNIHTHYEAPKLPISSQAFKEAKAILEQHHIEQPFTVLCPFAKGLNQQKQPKKWPHWAELSHQLSHHTHIICPGPDELDEAKTFFPNAIILEKVPLNVYASILSMAKLVVANDSGPLHISAAVGAQTIGLFGATDSKRAAPINSKVLGQTHNWPSLDTVLQQIQHKYYTKI